MDSGIYVALSGSIVQEKRMEALADNLANVNTTGFKKQKPMFRDAAPDQSWARVFAQVEKGVTDMTQGVNERTERQLDVAINGEGFFSVKTPYGTRYTRDGSFTLSPDGMLVTREGHPVLGERGEITLAKGDVAIDALGNIESRGIRLDSLKIVNFDNPSALLREGSLFTDEGTKVKQTDVPETTQLQQGYVESSNVNVVKVMTTMIEAMRSYETHTKMIQSMDDMTRKAIDEVGRSA